jgi:hypothetical protein
MLSGPKGECAGVTHRASTQNKKNVFRYGESNPGLAGLMLYMRAADASHYTITDGHVKSRHLNIIRSSSFHFSRSIIVGTEVSTVIWPHFAHPNPKTRCAKRPGAQSDPVRKVRPVTVPYPISNYRQLHMYLLVVELIMNGKVQSTRGLGTFHLHFSRATKTLERAYFRQEVPLLLNRVT